MSCSTWACGATWLRPLSTASAKSGAGTWKREALADEAGELGLVLERVDAGDDAAGAVAEQEHRQARARATSRASRAPATSLDVVGELLDVEALAVGLAAAAQVERVDGEAARHELLGDPA